MAFELPKEIREEIRWKYALLDENGKKKHTQRELGKEYGATTGRPRRCGWFDVNLVNQSVKINGIDNLILTKLDILDDLEEIKICTGYLINKKKYDYLPSNEIMQLNIIPVYESLDGWKSSTFGLDNPPPVAEMLATIFFSLFNVKCLSARAVIRNVL